MLRQPYLVCWHVDLSDDGSQQLLDVAPLPFIEDGMLPLGKATTTYINAIAHTHGLDPDDVMAEIRHDEWVEKAYLAGTLLEGVL